MDASQLVIAVSASLFALLGIWAAAVRRHWFLRTAAVGSVLLLALLIPAYELVIQFSVELAVITSAVWIYRRSQREPLRASLESVLLAMAVVAVAAAVYGRAPDLSLDGWLLRVVIGLGTGLLALVCLWVVCGRARGPWRAVGGLVAAIVLLGLFNICFALKYALFDTPGIPWRTAFVQYYTTDLPIAWLRQISPIFVLGSLIVLTTVALGRASGWFSDGDAAEQTASSRRGVRIVSRLCLCGAFGVIAAGNFFLLYKLCTRPVLPPVVLPADNGYDDFLAAGRHPGANFSPLKQAIWSSWSDQDFDRAVAGARPAYDLIEAGLLKESWATSSAAGHAIASVDHAALINVGWALHVRLEQRRRQGLWDEIPNLCCQILEVGHESSRGVRSDYSLDLHFEPIAAKHVRMALGALSSSQCKDLAWRLLALDKLREPMSVKVERSYQFARGGSWQAYMQYLVRTWNGEQDHFDMSQQNFLINANREAAGMKLAIVELALQAYWLDHRALPGALSELVPEYLPAVPLDPFGNEPIKYIRDQGVYRVYSVERNGRDDGGVPYVQGGIGDRVYYGPHLPPAPYRWKRMAAEYFARGWNALKTLSNSAAPTPAPTAPR
jgi:hypothetical protein